MVALSMLTKLKKKRVRMALPQEIAKLEEELQQLDRKIAPLEKRIEDGDW